jgi:lipid-A-disaccharide synthase
MRKELHLLIVAGDPSGDFHGAALVDALRQRRPGLRISALGGSHLRHKADVFVYPLVGIGGFGFWEPLLKLPQLWSAFSAVKTLLKRDPPDVVVPIDYYGFNIHVARQAHKAGIPVAYYVSPQIWASRPGRIMKLASVVNKMLVIFPFEVDLYQKAGVPVSFVGHPLIERLPVPAQESTEPTIGLLPGSRRGTTARHLPLLIQTAELLRAQLPKTRCVLFRPEEIEDDFYKPFLAKAPWIELAVDPSYDIRKRLWLAIGVSGTAALENMLLGIPMIIMYKLSGLTFWMAKKLIQVPYIGIPNLLAGRRVVPELLQDEATPDRLAETAKPFLADRRTRDEMRTILLGLRATLQDGGSARAAEEILSVIPAKAGIHGSPTTTSGMTITHP